MRSVAFTRRKRTRGGGPRGGRAARATGVGPSGPTVPSDSPMDRYVRLCPRSVACVDSLLPRSASPARPPSPFRSPCSRRRRRPRPRRPPAAADAPAPSPAAPSRCPSSALAPATAALGGAAAAGQGLAAARRHALLPGRRRLGRPGPPNCTAGSRSAPAPTGTGHWSGWQDVETHNDDTPPTPAPPSATSGRRARRHRPAVGRRLRRRRGARHAARADRRTAPRDRAGPPRSSAARHALPAGLRLELVDPGAGPRGARPPTAAAPARCRGGGGCLRRQRRTWPRSAPPRSRALGQAETERELTARGGTADAPGRSRTSARARASSPARAGAPTRGCASAASSTPRRSRRPSSTTAAGQQLHAAPRPLRSSAASTATT